MSDTLQRVREVLSEVLQVQPEAITPQMTRKDFEDWDSVQHLNIMLALEDEFDVTFEVEDLMRLDSIPTILERLESP